MRIKNRTVQNAAWIIGSKVVQSLLGLVISMITARYLGPANFGIINYAASIVMFVKPLAELGLSGILVQELVLNPEDEGEILGTSMLISLVSTVLTIGGIFCFTMIANRGEYEVILVCLVYSLMLVFRAFELIVYWFQAKLLSKYTSMVSLAVYLIVAAYRIFLLVTQKSVVWFACSYSLDMGLIAVFGLCLYRHLHGGKFQFSFARFRQMFAKSKYYILSGIMISVFGQTDRIMLKLMIDESATGFYSAAITVAGLTSFIFGAIIDSARPTIFKSRDVSQKSFEENMRRLYAVVISIALLQSVFIMLFAKWIVLILYGGAYDSAVVPLRIVVWYTTFSYIGAVRNIWLLAENNQHIIWKIDCSGAAANVILNLIFIPLWGINGAAIASLITQIFANFIMGWILREIRPNNMLMIQSLRPQVLCGLWSFLRK